MPEMLLLLLELKALLSAAKAYGTKTKFDETTSMRNSKKAESPEERETRVI